MEQVCLIVRHICHGTTLLLVVSKQLFLLLLLYSLLLFLTTLPCQCGHPVDPNNKGLWESANIVRSAHLLAAVSLAFMLEAMIARDQPLGQPFSAKFSISWYFFNSLHFIRQKQSAPGQTNYIGSVVELALTIDSVLQWSQMQPNDQVAQQNDWNIRSQTLYYRKGFGSPGKFRSLGPMCRHLALFWKKIFALDSVDQRCLAQPLREAGDDVTSLELNFFVFHPKTALLILSNFTNLILSQCFWYHNDGRDWAPFDVLDWPEPPQIRSPLLSRPYTCHLSATSP